MFQHQHFNSRCECSFHTKNYIYKEIQMRIVKLSVLVVVVLAFLVTVVLAGNTPNYDCAGTGNTCVEGCDKAAETSKNANNYSKCLAKCRKVEADCEKRQEKASICAESFQRCNEKAKTESDKNVCRAAYRKCKGE